MRWPWICQTSAGISTNHALHFYIWILLRQGSPKEVLKMSFFWWTITKIAYDFEEVTFPSSFVHDLMTSSIWRLHGAFQSARRSLTGCLWHRGHGPFIFRRGGKTQKFVNGQPISLFVNGWNPQKMFINSSFWWISCHENRWNSPKFNGSRPLSHIYRCLNGSPNWTVINQNVNVMGINQLTIQNHVKWWFSWSIYWIHRFAHLNEGHLGIVPRLPSGVIKRGNRKSPI